MLDFLFALMAVAANAADGAAPPEVVAQAAPTEQAEAAPTEAPSVIIGENVTAGAGVTIGGQGLLEGTNSAASQPESPAVPQPDPSVAAGGPAINRAVIPAGLVAEPQTPSGKFTTATEVRPILDATKGSWVAVREYDGKDLLYVTHLWAWRCGLSAIAISINDEPMQNWPLPPCHLEYATPNAILEDDGAPYLSLQLGGVQTITLQVVYDDLSVDVARFERGTVLIP